MPSAEFPIRNGTAGSALIEILLQNNLAWEKKPDTIEYILHNSCYDVQKQSKLIYGALSQGSGSP